MTSGDVGTAEEEGEGFKFGLFSRYSKSLYNLRQQRRLSQGALLRKTLVPGIGEGAKIRQRVHTSGTSSGSRLFISLS